MRKFVSILAAVALALPTLAPAAGPKFSTSGGVGSATSTFSGGEPTGGTYTINGTTGTVSAPIVNLRPGAAPSSPQNGDCWTTTAGLFCRINGATVGPYGAATGTVTQVGLVTPSIFTAGGAVTTSGNLSFSLNNQATNTVFAGPNGSTGTPAFRSLVGADIPAVNLAGSGNGGVTGTLAVANGGTGSTTASAARTALGLSTMATQNAATVAITGGSVTGITDLAVADGGTGASDAGTARTNLGLGTIATQAASSVAITGGSITGITDLAVADGGTGASTAGAARTNLGATAVGSNLFTLTNPSAVTFPRFNADNSVSTLDAASTRTALGLGTAATQNTGTSGATVPLLNGANTWSADQTFSGTINGAKVAPSCANILAYGGNNSGSVDNAAAWTAALAANNGQQVCVYFPRGTYLFNTSASMSLATGATGAAVTVKGDGQEVSTLKFASGVSGLGITLNERTQSFHVENLSLVTAGTAGTTYGLRVVQTNAPSPMPSQSSVTNVGIHGSDGYAQTFFWDYGIQFDYVSNVTMSGVNVIGAGGAAYSTQGICFNWYGSSSSIPVQVNIYGSQFNYCNEGIRYGTYAQGLQITTSNFVGNSYGIYVPSGQAGNDELGLSNNQFNSGQRNIYVASAVDGLMVVGNMFYSNLNDAIHIELAVADQFVISSNTFVPLGTGHNGIVIGTGGVGGIITANAFRAGVANFATGVWLQAGSSYVNVQSNNYRGVTTPTINSGSNNTIGGGSQ